MKRIVSVLVCAVVALGAAVAGSAEAADWTITTITDNTHNDTEPRVSDSYVVWQGFVGGNDAEVMFHDVDGGGITQVTDNGVQDYEPRASGSHVVWYEFQHGEIYAWPVGDPVVHTPISDSAYYNNMPRISGPYVVWQGRTTGSSGDYEYDLFVYNLNTKKLAHLDLDSPGDLYPNISGSTVVYQTGASGATEVYLYDASKGVGPVLLADSAKYPKVSGGHAIWQGLDGNEVFLCEITDGTPGAVRQLTGSAASAAAPQIAGSRVVWESDADGDYEIILYDIASDVATQITDNTGTDAYLQISESLVAWRWRSGAQYAVFAYVFDDPQAVPEQLAPVNAKPQVSGSSVVWGASDGHDGEIYLAEALPGNQQPVADAGQDQTAHPGDEVTLDGRESYDDDGDPITFAWEIITRPADSDATLSDAASPTPTFFADAPGTYVISLVVSDGFKDSRPDNVTVEAVTVLDAIVEELMVAIETINDLDPADFKNRKHAKTLVNKINGALKKIEKGDCHKTIKKLEKDILRKMDGCAETGAPDKNDWLRTCEAQEAVYPSVARAIELLREASE